MRPVCAAIASPLREGVAISDADTYNNIITGSYTFEIATSHHVALLLAASSGTLLAMTEGRDYTRTGGSTEPPVFFPTRRAYYCTVTFFML